jgi:hypothetical protein
MIDFVHDQNWSAGWGASFDELAIHMVRGYETAWRRAAHAAA